MLSMLELENGVLFDVKGSAMWKEIHTTEVEKIEQKWVNG